MKVNQLIRGWERSTDIRYTCPSMPLTFSLTKSEGLWAREASHMHALCHVLQ
jgi:hypothetical protein